MWTAIHAARAAMRLSAFAAFLSLLVSWPAAAQQLEIGAVLACDTQQQVERFVSVFRGDADSAARTVNTEASDPTACDTVALVYVTGREVATVRTGSRTFRIVRILVLGVATPRGVMMAEPTALYSYVQVDERAA